MFRSAVRLSSFLALLCTTLWISYLCMDAKEAYHHLRQKIPQKTAEKTAQQMRKHVRKDLWVSGENHQRLHSRMDSDLSFLNFLPGDGQSIDVVEELGPTRCYLQEKIYTLGQAPVQQLRFLQTQKGTYQYRSQTFHAVETLLSLYRIPGTSLPLHLQRYTPFLQGTAQKATFSLKEGTPLFEANGFQASLHSEGSS